MNNKKSPNKKLQEKVAISDEDWDDYSEEEEEEEVVQVASKPIVIEEKQVEESNPTSLHDVVAESSHKHHHHHKGHHGNNKSHNFKNKNNNNYNKDGKRTFYNSQKNDNQGFNNSNSLMNENSNYASKTDRNDRNRERPNFKYNNNRQNEDIDSKPKLFNNSAPSNKLVNERPTFKYNENRKNDDIDFNKISNNNDNFAPKTKEDEKSNVMKKLGNIGGLLKNTSQENEIVKPPRDIYLETDLNTKYNPKTVTNKELKERPQLIPNPINLENKKSADAASNNDKTKNIDDAFGDIQKPTFTNKNLKDKSSNFVEISQDNDLFYKKLKEMKVDSPKSNTKHKHSDQQGSMSPAKKSDNNSGSKYSSKHKKKGFFENHGRGDRENKFDNKYNSYNDNQHIENDYYDTNYDVNYELDMIDNYHPEDKFNEEKISKEYTEDNIHDDFEEAVIDQNYKSGDPETTRERGYYNKYNRNFDAHSGGYQQNRGGNKKNHKVKYDTNDDLWMKATHGEEINNSNYQESHQTDRVNKNSIDELSYHSVQNQGYHEKRDKYENKKKHYGSGSYNKNSGKISSNFDDPKEYKHKPGQGHQASQSFNLTKEGSDRNPDRKSSTMSNSKTPILQNKPSGEVTFKQTGKSLKDLW